MSSNILSAKTYRSIAMKGGTVMYESLISSLTSLVLVVVVIISSGSPEVAGA